MPVATCGSASSTACGHATALGCVRTNVTGRALRTVWRSLIMKIREIYKPTQIYTCSDLVRSWKMSAMMTSACCEMYEKQLALSTAAFRRSAMASRHSTESSSISDLSVDSQMSCRWWRDGWFVKVALAIMHIFCILYL